MWGAAGSQREPAGAGTSGGSDHPARVERVALAEHERGHELAEGGWYDELWSATARVSHDRVAR